MAYALPGANPVDGVEKALPKQPDFAAHYAAMPYADVPAFMTALRRRSVGDATRLALEFLILTACRTNEVLLAAWNEIDSAEEEWTIPAARMKTNETHIVPLAPRALALLTEVKTLHGDQALVFPSQRPGKPLSNMVLLMTLRRMELSITAHGFRSSFRDWAAEETEFPNFVVEKALAHTIDNKVEAAYRRGDLLKKRRDLMISWANYCAGTTAPSRDKQRALNPKLQLTGAQSHDDDAIDLLRLRRAAELIGPADHDTTRVDAVKSRPQSRPPKPSWPRIVQLARKLQRTHPEYQKKQLAFEARHHAATEFPEHELPSLATIQRSMVNILNGRANGLSD